MTEQFIPHPPSPQDKDTVTFNKKNLAIAFLAVAIAILIIVIAASGSKSSSPATTAAPIVTNPPITAAPVTNKYDDYMNHVYNNSGQANTWTKAQLIEFGDLVCQALDEGTPIPRIVNLLSSYAKTTSDMELFASVLYGSITYICPEYKYALNEYLAN